MSNINKTDLRHTYAFSEDDKGPVLKIEKQDMTNEIQEVIEVRFSDTSFTATNTTSDKSVTSSSVYKYCDICERYNALNVKNIMQGQINMVLNKLGVIDDYLYEEIKKESEIDKFLSSVINKIRLYPNLDFNESTVTKGDNILYYTAKFGEFISDYQTGCPQMQVIISNEEGKTIENCWLTPYRGSLFIVSSDLECKKIKGSSTSMDYSILSNITKLNFESVELIRGQAVLAVENYLHNLTNKLNTEESHVEIRRPCYSKHTHGIPKNDFDVFIEESTKWSVYEEMNTCVLI